MPGKLIKRNHKIGLEVGTDRITGAVIQQQGRGIKLVNAVCWHKEKSNRKLSAEDIEQFVTDNLLIGKEMVVVIDDPSLYLKQLAVPKNLMEKSANEMKWYLEQFLPYPVARAAQSHHTCGIEFGVNNLIIVAILLRGVVDLIIGALHEVGASVSKIDILPFSLGRIYKANYDIREDSCIGLFDFDDRHGYGVVMKGGEIMSMRRFSLCPADEKHIAEAIEDTLRLFETQFPQDTVDRVYFTDRSPISYTVGETIRRTSGVDVKKIDPGRRIDIKDVDEEVLKHAVAAIGTALEDTQLDTVRPV